MFIPSTFKRPVSSWKALNLRKTLRRGCLTVPRLTLMSLIKMMLVMVSVAAISKTFGLLRFLLRLSFLPKGRLQPHLLTLWVCKPLMLICILTKNVIPSCTVTMMLFLHLEAKPLMTLPTALYLACALISGHLAMMLMELTNRRYATFLAAGNRRIHILPPDPRFPRTDGGFHRL